MTDPIFSPGKMLQRKDKEQLLGQRGMVVWLTGLSGAGKTTIAQALEIALQKNGVLTCLLDGDHLRAGINNNLGFSDADRTENIRRAAETAKLFVECGMVTICSFISPTGKIRELAKAILGDEDYFEVFVDTPIEVCEQRDVKGLYKKARRGEIGNFTGIHAAYERPLSPSLEVQPQEGNLEKIVRDILIAIDPKITG